MEQMKLQFWISTTIALVQFAISLQTRSGALSCQRFESILKLYCKKEHSYFIAILAPWCRDSFEKYFRLAGSLIKHFNIESGAEMPEVLVIKYCHSVEEIDYTNEWLNLSFIDELKNLVKNSKSFHSLSLYSCTFGDYVIEGITELPTINELTIWSNHLITGKYLSRLQKLKILSLQGCSQIKSEYLNEIDMKELVTLELKGCNEVTGECSQNLIKRCQNLSKLPFTCDFDDNQEMYKEKLMQISAVKELRVDNCTDDFLTALAEYESDQLENLSLGYELSDPGSLIYEHDWCFDYHNIVTKYQNLKELEIHRCWNCIMNFIPLKCLENIYLAHCYVTSAGIIHMLQISPKLIYSL